MGKVDWITYKTSIDEIIVPSEERAKVEEAYNNICGSFINKTIKEELEQEMVSGGLDVLSLNILGVSPANAMSREIVNYCDDINLGISELSNTVENAAIKQAACERNQLINAISEKIAEYEKLRNEAQSSYNTYKSAYERDEYSAPGDYNWNAMETWQVQIDIYNDEIKKLKEKRSTVIELGESTRH